VLEITATTAAKILLLNIKLTLNKQEFHSAAVFYARSTRQEPNTNADSRTWPRIQQCPQSSALSVDKKRDLKSVLKFMLQTDAEFYNTLFAASEDNTGASVKGISSTITKRASHKRLLLPASDIGSNNSTVKVGEHDTGMSARTRRASRKRLHSLTVQTLTLKAITAE